MHLFLDPAGVCVFLSPPLSFVCLPTGNLGACWGEGGGCFGSKGSQQEPPRWPAHRPLARATGCTVTGLGALRAFCAARAAARLAQDAAVEATEARGLWDLRPLILRVPCSGWAREATILGVCPC